MHLFKLVSKHFTACTVIYFAMLVIAVLSKNDVLAFVIGLIVLTPAQLNIHQGRASAGVGQYIKEIFTLRTLSYSLGIITSIFLPGMLLALVVMAFPPPSQTVLIFIVFPPLFSFAYAQLAPILHKTATGSRGIPMKARDMVQIAGAIYVFLGIPKALVQATASQSAIGALVNLITTFTTIILLCFFSAIVHARNKPVEG